MLNLISFSDRPTDFVAWGEAADLDKLVTPSHMTSP